MKAPDFRYERPASLEAALALLADEAVDAAPLAGGQSLMPMMNFRMAAPEMLVDLGALEGLSGVALSDGWLEIGATTRWRELETSPEVARHAPLIARVLPHIAHTAIRNRGTIGGSVALADPAAEIPAVLRTLGGSILLQSAHGSREMPADDFFLGVYQTARAPDELVIAVRVPAAAEGQRFGFAELARRHGDYAIAGCCIAAAGDLSTVRAAFFGIADRPLRVEGVEAALTGGGDIEAAVAGLGCVEVDADLHAGVQTKRHLAGVVLRRAWAEASA